MPLLNEQDRAYILEQLKLAPDEVLADAMLAFNRVREKIVTVRGMTSQPKPTADQLKNDIEAYERELVTKNAPRPNVSPGKPAITKIGSETKAALLLDVGCGKQPAAKFAEHLKLLWSRGEVKFDGKEWYL